MPKKELKPSTVKKMQEIANEEKQSTLTNEQQAEIPKQEPVQQPEEITQQVHTPEPIQEKKPIDPHGNINMNRIEEITRGIMNRDIKRRK